MSLAVCTNRNSGPFVGVLSCAVALNWGEAHKNAAEKKTSASLLVAGRGRRAIALPPLLLLPPVAVATIAVGSFTSAADGTRTFRMLQAMRRAHGRQNWMIQAMLEHTQAWAIRQNPRIGRARPGAKDKFPAHTPHQCPRASASDAVLVSEKPYGDS